LNYFDNSRNGHEFVHIPKIVKHESKQFKDTMQKVSLIVPFTSGHNLTGRGIILAKDY
jgi:hypothetical protein